MCSLTYSSWYSLRFERVVDEAPEEGDVRAGADRDVEVGDRGSAGEARIDHDELGVAVAPRLHDERKPTGWFSAGLPPMARTTSAFSTSIQPLVIAPRPNVAAKLATVGPCQRRAWFS